MIVIIIIMTAITIIIAFVFVVMSVSISVITKVVIVVIAIVIIIAFVFVVMSVSISVITKVVIVVIAIVFLPSLFVPSVNSSFCIPWNWEQVQRADQWISLNFKSCDIIDLVVTIIFHIWTPQFKESFRAHLSTNWLMYTQ